MELIVSLFYCCHLLKIYNYHFFFLLESYPSQLCSVSCHCKALMNLTTELTLGVLRSPERLCQVSFSLNKQFSFFYTVQKIWQLKKRGLNRKNLKLRSDLGFRLFLNSGSPSAIQLLCDPVLIIKQSKYYLLFYYLLP